MKVLIVDDDAIVRRALSRAFKGAGHEADLAVDGEDGFQRWIAFKPDVVLLDVIMPKMTGYEVLLKLDELPSAKVILMSAFSGDHPDSHRAIERSDLFISKPFENIFEVVKEAEGLVNESK